MFDQPLILKSHPTLRCPPHSWTQAAIHPARPDSPRNQNPSEPPLCRGRRWGRRSWRTAWTTVSSSPSVKGQKDRKWQSGRLTGRSNQKQKHLLRVKNVLESYCSQVQDGLVPSFAVLLFVLVTELCSSTLDELKGLQHSGRVGHVGFTGSREWREEVSPRQSHQTP